MRGFFKEIVRKHHCGNMLRLMKNIGGVSTQGRNIFHDTFYPPASNGFLRSFPRIADKRLSLGNTVFAACARSTSTPMAAWSGAAYTANISRSIRTISTCGLRARCSWLNMPTISPKRTATWAAPASWKPSARY